MLFNIVKKCRISVFFVFLTSPDGVWFVFVPTFLLSYRLNCKSGQAQPRYKSLIARQMPGSNSYKQGA